jgi:hypothetical protein
VASSSAGTPLTHSTSARVLTARTNSEARHRTKDKTDFTDSKDSKDGRERRKTTTQSAKDVPVVTYEGRKKLLAKMVGGQVYKLNSMPLVQLESFYSRPTDTGMRGITVFLNLIRRFLL